MRSLQYQERRSKCSGHHYASTAGHDEQAVIRCALGSKIFLSDGLAVVQIPWHVMWAEWGNQSTGGYSVEIQYHT